MKDQVDKLVEADVPTGQLNSALTAREEQQALDAIRAGDLQIIFTTPERLTDERFVAALDAHTPALFVVDEAHCISQWGHDFRPAFLELAGAIRALGNPCTARRFARRRPRTNRCAAQTRAYRSITAG